MDLLQIQNKDLATGKKINAEKPEEKVRQEYEQILHDDYEYAFDQMDIEVSIQRGEIHSQKNRERADIVIYKTTDVNKRDQNLDILGIIETKKLTSKEGIRQLKSYMSATSCKWGVWTNGEEIEYLYRDLKTGEIKDNYVYQIPKNGETFEDIGKVSKLNLTPASNLKAVFRRLLATLYTNTNISRREKLGNEMIRLIFCKILDEKYDPHALPRFRVGFEEDYREVAKRVHELFEEVKNELGDEVFDTHDKIMLEDKSIAKVVGELEQYSLLKTNKDVVGDAFEVFAESKLVGEKGEFFTPREVVKTAVQIINPQPGDTIMDPACGSGGFLIYSLEHIWEQMDSGSIRKYNGMSEVDLAQAKSKVAAENFFGIDKEMDLVKISKAYMAIIGDGRSKIAQQNTLHTAEDFEGKARDIFVDETGKDFKKFDVVLSNPPFGNKIKVLKEDSKHFQLGHIWKKEEGGFTETNQARETEPQILFIERCLQLLKDGGKLAIIIPETYFHAPKVKYVLDYMRKGNNFVALIDLAHNTFRPYNNAKTILLILEKGRPQQENIVMAVAEQIGHDHNGKPMFRYDPETHKFSDEVWDDTVTIREELKDPASPDNKNTFVVKASDIKNDVYVPRYYWKQRVDRIRREAESQGLQFVQVKTLLDKGILDDYSGHGSPASMYKGKGAVPYVRVADIVNWAIYKNPTAMVPESVYRSVKANGVDLQQEDVLFVRRGSYRIGSVAMVSPYDKDVLLTREIQVLRVIKPDNEYDIDAYYLLYLLSNQITQKQLPDKVMIDTTLPNIGRRWEDLYLPVSTDPAVRKAIAESVKQAIQNRWDSQRGIFDLAAKFGQITT